MIAHSPLPFPFLGHLQSIWRRLVEEVDHDLRLLHIKHRLYPRVYQGARSDRLELLQRFVFLQGVLCSLGVHCCRLGEFYCRIGALGNPKAERGCEVGDHRSHRLFWCWVGGCFETGYRYLDLLPPLESGSNIALSVMVVILGVFHDIDLARFCLPLHNLIVYIFGL